MSGENQFSSLNGWFKELYASEEARPVPKAAWLCKNVDFNKAERGVGNKYHMPVVLTLEHGFTYAGVDAGAFSLNAAQNSVMKDASVEGTQIVLRSRMDYETAARAANTKASFGQGTKLLVRNMLDSISKRLEIMFLYGRKGIGAVNATVTTTATFVISAASWAAAMWAGMENASVDIVVAALTAFDDSGAASNLKILSVDMSTRSITLTTAPAQITAASLVFFHGAMTPGGTPVYRESLGLDAIITEATTLFGIDVSTYKMFAGQSSAVGSVALTVTKILAGLLASIGKGLMKDVVLLVSPKGFQGLVNPVIDPAATTGSTNTQVGATRIDKTDSAGDSLKLGASEVVILGNQGKITIVPHLFVKDGEAFAFPLEHVKRVGATDTTFNLPGRGDEFFLQLPDNAGFELRAYANQALFVEYPAWCTKYTGIV